MHFSNKFVVFTNFLSALLLVSLVVQFSHGFGQNHTKSADSKNILFYMGLGTVSMRMSVWPLVEALTDKGHHVTFLSPYTSKTPHPRVFDYAPKKLKEYWLGDQGGFNVFEMRKTGKLIPFWLQVPQFGVQVCEKMFQDTEFIEWVKTSKFDLVFIDSFVNECAYSLAHQFQAKTIVYSTCALYPWFYETLGIPDDSSWATTDISLGLPVGDMTFFERTINAVMPVYWKFVRELWYLPKLQEITKAGLNQENVPSFIELERNTSLTFVTTHYSQEFARALPPNVVAVGGLALKGKLEPISKEIEDFINRGAKGFIYISFGTVGEFQNLDQEIRENFVKAVLKFPEYQFIWKSTKGVEVKLPENFLVLKWAPQQSLIAHAKIKAFITHAGLGGINEAIYYSVPLIAFPIFAEQDYNANLVEAKEIGVKLEVIRLKTEQLENAIKTVVESPRIKQNMAKVSKLFKTRPQDPLDAAVWWTEFVLEQDSATLTEFLRPRNVNQAWWVKRQLDVWLFILAIIVILIGIFYLVLKCVFICVMSRLSNLVLKKNVAKPDLSKKQK